MNVQCPDKFLPAFPNCNTLPNYRILTEDIEQIAIVKAALRSCTVEQERVLLSVQRRLQEGKNKIELCTKESNAIELELNAVEAQIAQALQLTQAAESEALKTVKENGAIKRKIIALKSDVEEQGRIIKRAKETMQVITDNYVLNNNNLKKF
ncbi:hypothetical protein JTE90_017254 [Oedothorax gibbosus]|uniref:Uncharacterized protein n=1 Tax=Oedothorax gibbosus TaxID=931172 RepID=A0AAV6VFH5_9ARAC|nr:hypothetical protein JTE90_017254 [Oedothorax gibbosus]